FVNFLLAWQHVAPDSRMQGPQAIEPILDQLEGFEAPAGAWETEILHGRLADYEPARLGQQWLSGRLTWARLQPRNERPNGNSRAAPVRSTPIALLSRRHAPLWMSLSTKADAVKLSRDAQAVADCIRQHGASFFDELVDGTGLL